MYNKAILIGNLTRDPELRYTPSGTPVTSFGIAVNTRYKQSDEMKEETLFIDIVVFGKQAESCSQYLSKGNPVLVEGRLQERRWESEGQHRRKVEVVAQTVRFLPKRISPDVSGGQQEAGITPPEEITDIEPF